MQDRNCKEFQSKIRNDVIRFEDYKSRIKMYIKQFKGKQAYANLYFQLLLFYTNVFVKAFFQQDANLIKFIF